MPIVYVPSEDCLRDVAEILEPTPEESLSFRNSRLGEYRDLGPIDMVQVIKAKTRSRQESRQIGSYHFVSGLDSSSSASIAAYISDLNRSLEASGSEGAAGSSWLLLGGRQANLWKIVGGTVCCWNAFSKVDVRVEVSIPGGVRSYAVDQEQKIIPTTGLIWMETYVSSMLRSILGHDGPSGSCGMMDVALRQLELFREAEGEAKFLEACTELFWDGWKLGTPLSTPQQATSTNNRLSLAILQFYLAIQRPQVALDFFNQFLPKDGRIADLMAKCHFALDRQSEALKLLHDRILAEPRMSSAMLRTQAEFLLEWKDWKMAGALIKESIKLSPMELEGWLLLARLHLAKEEYQEALSVLNSFPYLIPTSSPPFNPSLVSAGIWIPRRDPSLIDLSIMEQQAPPQNSLTANLRGTPKLAYALLSAICQRIGWDALLEHRTAVFVMEEEYVLSRSASKSGNSFNEMEAIRKQHAIMDPHQLDRQAVLHGKTPIGPADQEDVSVSQMEQSQNVEQQKKKLCERWLDSLFTLLYEDLKAYGIYRAELESSKAEGMPYQRTPRDWLGLAELCLRLGKTEDAKEAYERCIDTGFCRAAWLGLLSIWINEDRLSHALTAITHLAKDSLNRYQALLTLHPHPVTQPMASLLRKYGAQRVRAALTEIEDVPLSKALLELLDFMGKRNVIGSTY